MPNFRIDDVVKGPSIRTALPDDALDNMSSKATALREGLTACQQQQRQAQLDFDAKVKRLRGYSFLDRAEQAEADLQRLSTAHETLQAAHDQLRAERDAARLATKSLAEVSARLSCGHDGCYGESRVNDDGTWELLHCWQCRAEKAEAELASLRSSRETEQRQLYDSLNWLTHVVHGVGMAGGSPEPGEFEAAVASAETSLAAYQQRQPLEGS